MTTNKISSVRIKPDTTECAEQFRARIYSALFLRCLLRFAAAVLFGSGIAVLVFRFCFPAWTVVYSLALSAIGLCASALASALLASKRLPPVARSGGMARLCRGVRRNPKFGP